ncbi:hypothetical protein CC79DRAFT_1151825 [Sarocladium strictum]
MANTFDQFAAFGTDIVGLERILRGVQSLLQIFAAWPMLLTYISSSLSIEKISLLAVSFGILQSRVGLARRIIRTFFFLNSFKGGYTLVQGKTSDQGVEVWLDVLNKSMLGIWGMLESVTLLDMFAIPGLEVFGPVKTGEYNRQAQICWFVALVASTLSGLVKISKTAERGSEAGQDPTKVKEKISNGKEKVKESKDKTVAVKDAQASAKVRQLSIKVVADIMDMILPASGVGWVNVDGGIVASVMLVTTFLTGKDAWYRCGREVAAKA